MHRRWQIQALAIVCLLTMATVPSGPGYAQDAGSARDPAGRIGPRGPYEILSIAPSPTWTTDGTALVLRFVKSSTYDLARTRDGGQTWQLLSLPEEKAGRRELWYVQGPSGRIAF